MFGVRADILHVHKLYIYILFGCHYNFTILICVQDRPPYREDNKDVMMLLKKRDTVFSDVNEKEDEGGGNEEGEEIFPSQGRRGRQRSSADKVSECVRGQKINIQYQY